MNKIGAKIAKVFPDSLAQKYGLEPGDEIIGINSKKSNDLIEFNYTFCDELVEIEIKKKNNKRKIIRFEKEYDTLLGVELESAVFDNIKRCINNCIFCFVEQLPLNMRQTLYVKDDDYRMSFINSSFITLTNITQRDFKRIYQYNISPLYISVHTTDTILYKKMVRSKRKINILESLKKLAKNKIKFHLQLVLCPNWNDKQCLDKTIFDLYQIRKSVLSLAIVPVGMTKYREKLVKIENVTSKIAQETIKQIECWQKKIKMEKEKFFIYLADEFFLQAKYKLPPKRYYNEYLQLENGIGISRLFIEQWNEAKFFRQKYKSPLLIDVICGKLAEPILKILLSKIKIANLYIRLVIVENEFFGKTITVNGLLTGQDIIKTLKKIEQSADGIIIPSVAVKGDEDIFLDNITIKDLAYETKVTVEVACGGAQLKKMLYFWKRK